MFPKGQFIMPDNFATSQAQHVCRDYCQCPACTAWADYHEARHALDLLAARDAEVRQAKPATPAEWCDFLDAEFPRAGGAS
jgi:hypothetical protein